MITICWRYTRTLEGEDNVSLVCDSITDVLAILVILVCGGLEIVVVAFAVTVGFVMLEDFVVAVVVGTLVVVGIGTRDGSLLSGTFGGALGLFAVASGVVLVQVINTIRENITVLGNRG